MLYRFPESLLEIRNSRLLDQSTPCNKHGSVSRGFAEYFSNIAVITSCDGSRIPILPQKTIKKGPVQKLHGPMFYGVSPRELERRAFVIAILRCPEVVFDGF
jgi:hypothetical protein